MHRESRIYRQIGHFLMPSSGNLVTKNKQLSRAVDLLRQASEEIDRLTAELAEALEIIDRLRPCKVCNGSGDHKTDEQRWGKSSRNNCRHCHGFGYVLTGNRAKFRAAIGAGEGE